MYSSRQDFLSSPIEYLKGIGPAKAELLKTELAIFTFRDLFFHFPFRHIDRSVILPIKSIRDEGQPVQVKGILGQLQSSGPKYQRRLSARLDDGTGKLDLIWFQGASWLADSLQEGQEYIAYGKVNYNGYKFTMAHPELVPAQEVKASQPYEPVYSSTQKLTSKGLDSKGIRKCILTLIEKVDASHFQETFPPYLIDLAKLCGRYESLVWIHMPPSRQALEQAQHRIKFEELFFQQLRLLESKQFRKKNSPGPVFRSVGDLFNSFFKHHLAFELTGAQKKVIKEIRADTSTGIQMNRLLQGDVGSGKTIVALMVMLLAIDNGYQACLMAPTEILAQQHFASLTKALAGLSVPIQILTGSIKGNKRREILADLQQGHLKILVGTHALLEDPVVFQNLGLAVIDEQHRFGVAQRAHLWQKNDQLAPHILVMTATPIPRTLSMLYYGDLDISIINELPPGRKPIKTMHFYEKSRPQLIQFLKDQIAQKRQVYIVYPLIEESEKLDLKDLNNGYEVLLHHFPKPQYQISILHGRMKPDVKEYEMRLFSSGKTDILVATTVIEVGVDVPNASVMVIENAERFGLSQLHQLRGRVGRGAQQSYCILMSGFKLSQAAKTRLKTMVDTNDGFIIAEVDLDLRGPGDIETTQQSGKAAFRLVNMATDSELLTEVRAILEKILGRDPDLVHPVNQLLKKHLLSELKADPGWRKIS
jgi:ATP-dependent DNA helicase RecG